MLPRATRERIALAVAERRGDTYSVAQHARTARARRARPRRDLARPQLHLGRREGGGAARLPRGAARVRRPARRHLGEEAREAGWTDEEILEAVAHARADRVPEPDRERGGAAAGPDRPVRSCRRRLPSRSRARGRCPPCASGRRRPPPGSSTDSRSGRRPATSARDLQVERMNWKAPRYLPPPPIALGSPPDSHSLVRRAQRWSLWEKPSQRRSYLPAPPPRCRRRGRCRPSRRGRWRRRRSSRRPRGPPPRARSRSGRAGDARSGPSYSVAARGRYCLRSCLFRSPSGLADGLAPKEMALRGRRRRFAPTVGSPDPRDMWRGLSGRSRHGTRHQTEVCVS